MKKFVKKIKNYYLNSRKKFKHIFYTLETLPILILIIFAVTVISFGGFKNLEEKIKFEYFVFNNQEICNNPSGMIGNWGKFSEYLFKSNVQYLDYFKDEKIKIIKLANSAKDDLKLNFNHCYFNRAALKAAHKGNQVAKDILSSMPHTYSPYYGSGSDEEQIFYRYASLIKKKKLSNPALKYNYAYFGKLDKPERKKLFKESAEEGYLLAMEDYLMQANDDYMKNKELSKSECLTILKYSKHLADQNSLLHKIGIPNALIGRNVYVSGPIYYCSGKKTDFLKAISKYDNFAKLSQRKANNTFQAVYPALMYYNGWGNVKKDKEIALKLFRKNLNSKYPKDIVLAYLALENFNNNDEKALEYLDKIQNKLNIENLSDLKSLKKFIYVWMKDWFKNEDMLNSLNLYG
ncbi:hypothetical protein N9S55_00895 [Candidatus Pelagibacter bacterium]|nr:hypothetical protein [Candidatus Pelagibacter bacterium]MDA9624923.1 hypothetical protein [Candidatus Pelagibacter bacterium]